MKNTKYIYFYAISLISLFILLWAMADLLRIILDNLFRNPPIIYYQENIVQPSIMPPRYPYPNPINIDDIAIRLAAILVSLPVYVFHWFKTSGDILKSRIHELTTDDFSKRKVYIQIVLIINSITILFGMTWIIYLFIKQVFSSIDLAVWSISAPFAYMLVALFSFIYHWAMLKDVDKQLEKVAPNQADTQVADFRFCGYCGSKTKTDFLYCSNCGKKMH